MNFGARKKIMLLGSSMTERSFSLEYHGWGTALANWYARTADVLNRGAGGYNSRWLRQFLPSLVGNERPDMVVLFIGNNDAIQEGESQHVPLNEYKANIIDILETLNTVNPSMTVLLMSTTRVNEAMKPLQKNKRRLQYAEVLRFIHRNRSVPELLGGAFICQNMAFIDLQGGDLPAGSAEQDRVREHAVVEGDLHDGAHLNAAGNKKVFAAIRDTINTQFPHLSPDVARPHFVRPKRTSSGFDLGASASLNRKRLVGATMDSPAVSPRKRAALTEGSRGEVQGMVTSSSSSGCSNSSSSSSGNQAEGGLQWTVPSWRALT